MKNFKNIIIYFFILISLVSCASLKKSLTPQKKSGSEEFLVEKKSPLVMPQNYNKLPKPKISEDDKKKKKIDIKQMVTGVENSNTDKSQSEPKSSIEELILKSIKKD